MTNGEKAIMAVSVDFGVDPAEQKDEKSQKKAPIQGRIGAFLVEISGIEPLTS